MTDGGEPAPRGRHRSEDAEPELPLPGGIVTNLAVFAVVLVITGIAVSAFVGWSLLLVWAVSGVFTVAVAIIGGMVDEWAEDRDRRARSAPDVVRRVEPRSDADLPVARRSDWTLPSQDFHLEARTQARLAETRRRHFKALAAALVLFTFFAGAGTVLSYVTHGTSHGCVDCD